MKLLSVVATAAVLAGGWALPDATTRGGANSAAPGSSAKQVRQLGQPLLQGVQQCAQRRHGYRHNIWSSKHPHYECASRNWRGHVAPTYWGKRCATLPTR